MTPAARLQAAIEILDEVIASARDDGPPADILVTRYFKTRRYAGSEIAGGARVGVPCDPKAASCRRSGRAALLGLAQDEPEFLELFGEARGPASIVDGELGSAARVVPSWLEPRISPLVAPSEWPALLERAPLDLRVNVARAARDAMLGQFPGAEPTRISPWGLRLPPDTKIDDHPAFADGLIDVQDEGSQLIAWTCEPKDGMRILDLCAGAGGKALALAAAAPGADVLATDSNRSRLSKLGPRAEKAGARIETRLLNPPLAQACRLAGAPTSGCRRAMPGSGTWRRNPRALAANSDRSSADPLPGPLLETAAALFSRRTLVYACARF